MINTEKIDFQKTGSFRFKRLGKDYLLTNETGDYVFLSEKDFEQYVQGTLKQESPQYKELCQKNFVSSEIDIDQYIKKYRQRNQYLFQAGPNLHIIVVTLRCDHQCLYCQSSSAKPKDFQFDMNKETAQKVVDFIFESRSRFLAIEFQGGEPLFNWPVIEFIIEYALKKNKREKRNLELRLVSNFTLMDEEKMNYLFKKGVIFCTSLDGPEKLHNKNRIWLNGNSYKQTIKWLKKTIKKYKKYYIYQPGALTTITRFSFPYYKEIINEYLKLGLDSIYLRPLTPLGMAKKRWEQIGYSPERFLDFYKKSLDYILSINLKNKLCFREMTVTYMAAKILTQQDPNHYELRSPCGAGIGQMLYNYNGDIYTCDEGRMLEQDTFKIGNINNTYTNALNHKTVKTICLASCLDNLFCDLCVYKPYCGTCPIVNYVESGNIFSQMLNNDRCRIYKEILDYLFQKIQESDRIKAIFKKWSISRYQY